MNTLWILMQDITDLNQLYPQSESVPISEALQPWVKIVQAMNETEKKREQRHRRCRNIFGVRCHRDCAECEQIRSGMDYSLDYLEMIGYEWIFADCMFNPADELERKEMWIRFVFLADSMDDSGRLIAWSFVYDLKDKEMMSLLHITRQSTYQYHKQKVRNILQKGLMGY